MARGVRLDSEVREAIEFLAAVKGWNAATIERWLGKSDLRDRAPEDRRTIQRYVRGVRQRIDPDAQWRRTEMAGGDARLVLEVQAAVLQRAGRTWVPTHAQARWILWVRLAAPTLEPIEVWQLAMMYFLRELDRTPDYADLDAYLALASWKEDPARHEDFTVLARLTRQMRLFSDFASYNETEEQV